MDATRLRVGVSVVVAAVISTAGIAATWGVYSNRLDILEQRTKDAEIIARSNQIAIAVTQSQYQEIIRKLDRIERKLANGERYEVPSR